MPAIPCLTCPSEACRTAKIRPIPLPPSTLVHSAPHPGWWPNDTHWLYAACPECRQVSAHLRFVVWEVQDSQSTPHADKVWLRISFRCAQAGCNTPVQFHVLWVPTVTQTTESELREKLRTGYWTGVSPCGHPIAIANDQKVLFDWALGRMLGYNPTDRFWSEV
jgi:hypothetical protein